MIDPLVQQLEQLRSNFAGGSTRTFEFRRYQLAKLRLAILQYEKELHETSKMNS